ncbi:hypothetical protein FSP39_024584 [Pinctada imbricata]|uniref:Uncharacterized protein n=1 Tax=Pinctada imbricata TaxID=66713 RepID=A0AA88YBV9_PINIB|nr:hypothetical protein FSP39_024584 [Pinctada imbricata]
MLILIIQIFILCDVIMGQCSVPQCTCLNGYVDCSGRKLTNVPSFPTNMVFYSTYQTLDLSNNNLTVLRNGDFNQAPFKKILLRNNHIRSIDAHGFHGAANTLIELDLSNNELHYLPVALSELESIKKLDVSGNPIEYGHNFNESVMKSIGDTILEFSFGGSSLSSWPRSLKHFPLLQSLTLDGTSDRLTIVPPDGFHGFTTTILKLNIRNTKLIGVPLGISRLRNLRELHFDNNPYVGDRGILVQSFPTGAASNLHTMSLNGDNLTKLPVVLRYLPSLRNLSMDNNPLHFINDNEFGELRTINYLSMKNCSFPRIPAALSDFTFLQELDLSYNHIATIDENDLEDLRFLEHLTISNNEVKYISQDAFGRVPRLKSVNFTNTNLTSVPRGIGRVWPCMEDVHVENNPIDCMCETLVWLRDYRDQCRIDGYPVQIHGKCDTIYDDIEHYIQVFIPHCPEYKEIHGIPPYN